MIVAVTHQQDSVSRLVWPKRGEGLMQGVIDGRDFAGELRRLGEDCIDRLGAFFRIGEELAAEGCFFGKHTESDSTSGRRLAHQICDFPQLLLLLLLLGASALLEQYQDAIVEILRGTGDRKRNVPCFCLEIPCLQIINALPCFAIKSVHHNISSTVLGKKPGSGQYDKQKADSANHRNRNS